MSSTGVLSLSTTRRRRGNVSEVLGGTCSSSAQVRAAYTAARQDSGKQYHPTPIGRTCPPSVGVELEQLRTTNVARTRTTLRVVFVIAAGLSLSSAVHLHASAAQKRTVQPGFCDGEAEKLLHQKPVRIRGSVRAPKKIRDVRPNYPEAPAGTVGTGIWIGEALINNSGKVVGVWPLREVEFTPPFPSFNSAITDAIRQWEFEPLLVQGKPAPVCMTVTVTINWQ